MNMRFYILLMLAMSVCRGSSEASEELLDVVRDAEENELTDIGKNGKFVTIN
ncbi:MAG: hypothetical protein DHS20C13_29890 [Thermodesulfobacteriota bacterium]|nr:MAG: hypothetical protein DHS20C13_29890 [Thermodesulfobacteriota bacterium]